MLILYCTFQKQGLWFSGIFRTAERQGLSAVACREVFPQMRRKCRISFRLMFSVQCCRTLQKMCSFIKVIYSGYRNISTMSLQGRMQISLPTPRGDNNSIYFNSSSWQVRTECICKPRIKVIYHLAAQKSDFDVLRTEYFVVWLLEWMTVWVQK